MRAGWLLVFALAGAGCATTSTVPPSAHRAAMASVPPAQRLEVWRRAIAVLLDDGYIPELLDEPAAFIRARRLDNTNVATFLVAPDGVARLELSGVVTTSFFDDPIVELGKRQTALLKSIVDPRPAASK